MNGVAENVDEKVKHEPLLYMILKPIAVLLFSIVFFPRVKGLKNIPKNGAAVLAGNHTKTLDCFMVMMGTYRCVHFLAKAELFKNGFLNSFFTAAGLIPVHRSRKDHEALVSAENYLSQGRIVALFPEGTVNKERGTVLPLKMGAVKMAHDTGSCIVPFTITGRYIPFVGGIKIEFHKPITADGDDLEAQRDILSERISSGFKEAI